MKIALSARQLSLCLIALASVGLLRWLAVAPTPPLYAQTSPLATPWPTLVVTYQPALPTTTPILASTATAVRVTFVFHSPLPTPTAIPDFVPPQTTSANERRPQQHGLVSQPSHGHLCHQRRFWGRGDGLSTGQRTSVDRP